MKSAQSVDERRREKDSMATIQSEQGEHTRVQVFGEARYGIVMKPQDRFNLPRRAVSTAHPDYLWRKTEQRAQITKIGILADDHIPLVASEVPNKKSGARSSPIW